MTDERPTRLSRFEGARSATVEHFEATETGLRKLDGVKPVDLEKILAGVRKQRETLLDRIDVHIREEMSRVD